MTSGNNFLPSSDFITTYKCGYAHLIFSSVYPILLFPNFTFSQLSTRLYTFSKNFSVVTYTQAKLVSQFKNGYCLHRHARKVTHWTPDIYWWDSRICNSEISRWGPGSQNIQVRPRTEDPLTLIWVGVWVILLPLSCWFSLNNSETLKAVTLVFYNIQ